MLVVVALGITWILDGLEVTLAGSVAGALKASPALQLYRRPGGARRQRLSARRGGRRARVRLADRPARPQEAVFHHHRGLSDGDGAHRRSPGTPASFFLFRFLTGAGIGGEYAAVNSTIQELVPARYRGFTDLVINGSFWVGAALGALVAVVLLNPACSTPTSAGGWPSSSARRSALVVFFCGCGSRKARAGW